jgi:two-component system, cell cycle sensor histidine kinase and response regulator CckA
LSPVDLNTTVRHVTAICRNSLDKTVTIETSLPPENQNAYADPLQMEQVLLNLCINASHAMTIMRKEGEPWGGTLKISLQPLPADRNFIARHPEAGAASYIRISVADTGVGMDSRTAPKIFDPFFTTKEKGKGTGLGLAMVYNIVKQHSGFIDVHSEPARGSIINIYIPAFTGGLTAARLPEEKGIVRGSGTILIVDDEEIMRNAAHTMLQECGYKVIVASDGSEALTIYRSSHGSITAVLLDLAMPKKSGREVFYEMQKINKQVKVLLTTGFRFDDRVQELKDAGVSGFIQKPYTITELSEKITAITG